VLPTSPVRSSAAQRFFWANAWLAIALVAVKAFHLGVPGAATRANEPPYLPSLAAISYLDLTFVVALFAVGRVVLAAVGVRRRLAQVLTFTYIFVASLIGLYAIANVILFGVLGGFLTYPLMSLIGDVRMVRSSVAAHLTPRVALALALVPLSYALLVELTVRRVSNGRGFTRYHRAAVLVVVAAWIALGQNAYSQRWASRQDRRIAENPHWVLVSSWWQALAGEDPVRLTEPFLTADLLDFEPIGPPRAARPSFVVNRTIARDRGRRSAAAHRSVNVVLVVLESVAARWTSLHGLYQTTPNVAAETGRGIAFDSFYAHIGRSSNSLAAILLSAYPKIGFRDLTEEYPRFPGTSLATLFRDRGYRTGFVTPSDLSWAGWDSFLEGRGFDSVNDHHRLACGTPLSSWGVEDRCMVDGMLDFIAKGAGRPFFLMAWSQQTHHPYEPTPGVPLLDLLREPTPDDYELGRYLNVLHETDRHLGRLFDGIRQAGLDQDTLVVVTGDHGQAFGYPHDTYIQGRTVYEEDVHVPLMVWFPRLYRSPVRSNTVGSHVDLAPTIADLASVPAAPDWQGRSLFDSERPTRAYFYVAEDEFTLGVREGQWKYIFNLREGSEELYDLEQDPNEQYNLVTRHLALGARLRQRLAAWTEANRRQYERHARQTGT
jgi:phosphoglycerol transferase MdoB-like AlkP superfamily enzyme